MYISGTVGIAELRQHLTSTCVVSSRVSDSSRRPKSPVAELGPPPTTGAALERLIADGRVPRPKRRGRPAPLEIDGDPHALSSALDEIRGER